LWRGNIPETELEPIEPGDELPGGLVRDALERALELPPFSDD